MKRIVLILLVATSLFSANLYDNPARYPSSDYKLTMLKYQEVAGRDSIFTCTFDTLKTWMFSNIETLTSTILNATDTLKLGDVFKTHGNNDYWEFYGKAGGEPYQYYFYNGGISVPSIENGGDLNMYSSTGNIYLGVGDSLVWKTGSAEIGRMFLEYVGERPFLTLENTNVQFNTKTNMRDSLKIINYNRDVVASIDTLGNAQFDGHVHSASEISTFARDSAFIIDAPNTWYTFPFTSIHSPYNPEHFTYNADSTGQVLSDIGNSLIAAYAKIFTEWTGGNSTVGKYGRFVVGKADGTGRKYSSLGQYSSEITKTTLDQSSIILTAPMYLTTGDTVYTQVKVSDTDLLLQPHYGDFENIITGGLILKYEGTW